MTDRLYLWQTRKLNRRVHIENPETSRAFCQAENCRGGKAFDGRGAAIPAGRRLCGNCADLTSRDEAAYREPDLRVLMGERLADDDPPTAPPRVCRKRTQRSSRPEGRKPKRSTVKHHRPFDDPIPW